MLGLFYWNQLLSFWGCFFKFFDHKEFTSNMILRWLETLSVNISESLGIKFSRGSSSTVGNPKERGGKAFAIKIEFERPPVAGGGQIWDGEVVGRTEGYMPCGERRQDGSENQADVSGLRCH